MSKKLIFVIDKPLHGNLKAQEFLDAILMAAAFDQQVIVTVVGDGVFALLEKQQPEKLQMKNILPVFDSLSLYGIDGVVVEQEALNERGLIMHQLHGIAHTSTRKKINETMLTADHIFSF